MLKNMPLVSTASRESGDFSLRVANPSNATLMVRRIGYRALDISIGANTTGIVAALQRDPLSWMPSL